VHRAPGVPTPFRGRDDDYTSREKISRGEIADSRHCEEPTGRNDGPGCLKIESKVDAKFRTPHHDGQETNDRMSQSPSQPRHSMPTATSRQTDPDTAKKTGVATPVFLCLCGPEPSRRARVRPRPDSRRRPTIQAGIDVRVCSHNRLESDIAPCPKSANKRLMRRTLPRAMSPVTSPQVPVENRVLVFMERHV
jgi:hypothetical protein